MCKIGKWKWMVFGSVLGLISGCGGDGGESSNGTGSGVEMSVAEEGGGAGAATEAEGASGDDAGSESGAASGNGGLEETTGCTSDAECDDGNPCTVNTCEVDSGDCQVANAGDGTVCDSGTCAGGVCGGCPGVSCGGSCCEDEEVCSSSQACCTPQCNGVECGDDGCGGSCGGCPNAYICEEGTCKEDCETICAGKECGSVTGHSCICGVCPDETPVCSKEFKCEECVPDCGSRTCGPDGCGGSCGECGEGLGCIEYMDYSSACMEPCDADSCDPNLEECVETATGQSVCTAKSVSIPAGTFWMGCNNCEGSTVNDGQCAKDESPYHLLQMDAYAIDKTEVTAFQYMQCVGAGHCEYNDTNCYCTNFYQKWGELPTQCLSWTQAQTYCEWVGKTLPTEAQWEMAARGSCEMQGEEVDCKNDSRKYPWGNEEPTCDHAINQSCKDWEPEQGRYPVCTTSPLGDSPYGLCDMAGNAREYVADVYGSNYYCAGWKAVTSPIWKFCFLKCEEAYAPEDGSLWANPPGPEYGPKRVSKGGSSKESILHNRISSRSAVDPSESETNIGFRCATPVEAE